jgi:streptogramin lyase
MGLSLDSDGNLWLLTDNFLVLFNTLNEFKHFNLLVPPNGYLPLLGYNIIALNNGKVAYGVTNRYPHIWEDIIIETDPLLGTFSQYKIAQDGFLPPIQFLNLGPDGYPWYASLSKLGHILPNGTRVEYTGPDTQTNLVSIYWKMDGTGVVPDSNRSIYLISQQGEFLSSIQVPSASGPSAYSSPSLGLDGNLWLTRLGTGVGVFKNDSSYQEFKIAGVSSGLIPGPSGAFWSTWDPSFEGLVQIDINGKYTTINPKWPGPTPSLQFGKCVFGSDGRIITNEISGGRIIILDSDLTPHPYSLPSGMDAGNITPGPDGKVWFNLVDPSLSVDNPVIGRLDITGSTQFFDIPLDSSLYPWTPQISGIVFDQSRNIWCSDSIGNIFKLKF